MGGDEDKQREQGRLQKQERQRVHAHVHDGRDARAALALRHPVGLEQVVPDEVRDDLVGGDHVSNSIWTGARRRFRYGRRS